jgi:hypothetical protein
MLFHLVSYGSFLFQFSCMAANQATKYQDEEMTFDMPDGALTVRLESIAIICHLAYLCSHMGTITPVLHRDTFPPPHWPTTQDFGP